MLGKLRWEGKRVGQDQKEAGVKKPLAMSSLEDFWLVPREGCRTKKAPTPTLQLSYSDLTRNFSLFVCHSLHGGMGVGLGFEPPFLLFLGEC